ncbi:Pathogenesis-related thaumatin superfamily protein [Tripterygium wilfordii]|uniref:Pathogenesis-related thaumatin superfamily protein n=1 Tax=Tripterygium wilfordii TaxID=458696 RepID=A0A7J7DKJ1_TRIWF|nr:pathogenesis-related thaumatin-like protein 3.5 [Tripterygium wilfordii]KAF5746847.1 Pathogenesis-related thaumatin superfamily protein [Tripterygium wilfordii]
MEFFPAMLWLFILFGHGLAHQVTFYVHNKCPFPIWPGTASNTGQPVIADGGFYLASGDTARISAPWTWSGRIWARTGCNFNSNWKPTCETGDCDGRLACNGLVGTPPVTLVQFALQGNTGKPDFYDVSLVDGYNIPVFVSNRQLTPKCTINGCNKNLKNSCPPELQVVNANWEVVACKSACLAFNLDSFCCRNEYGTPEKCKPSVYSKLFRDACPSYYSYAYDKQAPLVTCPSSNEYVITFCPSSWGAGGSHSSV